MIFYTAKCSACDYEEEFEWPHSYVYRLAEMDLNILQSWAWCKQCKAIVFSEFIPDLDVIKREISKAETDRQVSIDNARLEWRQKRVSQAKCLACSSTEIQRIGNLSKDFYKIKHETCGGDLTIEATGLGSERYLNQFIYDSEGNKIEA